MRDSVQIQICRQIQGLPNRTANAAVYILLGLDPIQSVVDKLLLTFFGCIIQDEDSIEYRTVERHSTNAIGKHKYLCK